MFTAIKRTLTAVAAIVAVSAPSSVALARPVDLAANGSLVPAGYVPSPVSEPASVASPAPCGDVCSGHGYGSVSSTPTVARVSSPSGGFDWGDAGIGAAGAAVLLGAGVLGAAATRRRRTVVG